MLNQVRIVGLGEGNVYFAVSALDFSGNESELSEVVGYVGGSA